MDDYDTPGKVLLGITGIFAALCRVAGVITGMAEVWYTGPIGKLVGDRQGADLGFKVSLASQKIEIFYESESDKRSGWLLRLRSFLTHPLDGWKFISLADER